jgi:group I intron endonuclease
MYIGSTIDFAHRGSQHRAASKKGTSKFYEAMRTYGADKFAFTVLEIWPCLSMEELVTREFWWIGRFPPEILYNTRLKQLE